MSQAKSIDAKTYGLLLKLRKGATASFKGAELEKVAPHIGWKYEKRVVRMLLDHHDLDEVIRREGAQHPLLNIVSPGDPRSDLDMKSESDRRGNQIWITLNRPKFKQQKLLVEAHAKIHALVGQLSDRLVVLEVGDITDYEHTSVMSNKVEVLKGFPIRVGYEGKGFAMTAPTGEVFELTKKPDYNCIVLYDFWRDVKPFNLNDAAAHALGMQTVEDEANDKKLYGARYDLDNCGICPCCFRIQKLDASGALVHHGYRRPGDGAIYGDCFGVNRKPLEVSSEGSRVYLDEVLRGWAENRAAFHEALKVAKEIQIQRSEYNDKTHKMEKRTETINSKHPDFAAERQRQLWFAERERLHAEHQRDGFIALVANWESDVMPLERQTKRLPTKMMPYIVQCY